MVVRLFAKQHIVGSIPILVIIINNFMLELLITFLCILLAIAFFTIAERKVLASIQRRKGPNVTGF
jgi:NADH:ubiquinone oxidoreductase subunit H